MDNHSEKNKFGLDKTVDSAKVNIKTKDSNFEMELLDLLLKEIFKSK